jgi:hypothetical protein
MGQAVLASPNVSGSKDDGDLHLMVPDLLDLGGYFPGLLRVNAVA